MDHQRALSNPARLQALKRTGLMDSLPDPAYDRFVRLASRLTGSPVATITLVDDQRQFFKAAYGMGEPWASKRETPLSHSFCQYVASTGQPLVVEDARRNNLVQDNGAVADMNVIAYLGSPVRSQGKCIGSLCVIDNQPRRWRSSDRAALEDLADCLNAEMELRLIERLTRQLPGAVYLYDEISKELLYANDLARQYGPAGPCDFKCSKRFDHRQIPFGENGSQVLGMAIPKA